MWSTPQVYDVFIVEIPIWGDSMLVIVLDQKATSHIKVKGIKTVEHI
jgi:hypothetical protein